MELKQRIPNEEALKEVISKNITAITDEIRAEAGPIEAEYIKHKKLRKKGAHRLYAAIFFAAFALHIADDSQVNTDNETIIIIFVVALMLFFLILSFRLLSSGGSIISDFGMKVNKILFSKVLNLLQVQGSVIEISNAELENKKMWNSVLFHSFHSFDGSTEAYKVCENLKLSELVALESKHVNVYSIYEANHSGIKITGAEIAITKKYEYPSSQNLQGHFISLDLPRQLTGKTFVSNVQRLYAKADSTDPNAIKKIELEWNQFEKLLDVGSNDEVEARYVLTPDFMSDFYDWWSSKKSANIRVSFIGKKMFIFFTGSETHFYRSINKISEENITNYLFGLARPFLYIFHLIEDVR